jgi:ubiquitin fusion degradation protein 1
MFNQLNDFLYSRSYSFIFRFHTNKKQQQNGDKILLPPSAFDTLARLQVDYPMLFRLSVSVTGDNVGEERRTHSGVLEFTAEEGCCYIPFWMMQNLLIEEGTLITVTNVSLPKATFVKLQPQSVDFLEISNPRAVLEHALRNFSCVTMNDIIQIQYNNKNYHLALKEVIPAPAACIIETDCNVDFDAPVGYVEPERVPSNSVRSSACPSPATTATSLTTGDMNTSMMDDETKIPSGTRIVNGQIVRPGDNDDNTSMSRNSNAASTATPSSMIADRAGATGVQRNAAIPDEAPEIDYWAIQAGDGARLDGKQATPLKDTSGNVVDIRKVRAEAAQRRAAEQADAVAKSLPATGRTVTGQTVSNANDIIVESATTTTERDTLAAAAAVMSRALPAATLSKRTSRVGSKYSKLKSSSAAFGGK